MPTPTQVVVARVCELLSTADGLDLSIGRLQMGSEPEPPFRAEQVSAIQASTELLGQAGSKEPLIFQVYVDRVRNRMTEKFRRFSGTVHVVTEVRLSQDRLQRLTERLQLYVDAVADVLERNRGAIGEGIQLSGQYEATIEPVKKGGLHFQQSARVSCEVEVSR